MACQDLTATIERLIQTRRLDSIPGFFILDAICSALLVRALARSEAPNIERTSLVGMVHYSKKDWWLVGTALAAVVIPPALGALLLLLGSATGETGTLLIIIGTLTGVVLLWFSYPLYYRITSSELTIRCGILVRTHIPLASIDKVEPDRSLLGAPAWSLDRLRVDYRKNGEPNFIRISPDDKFAFMQELARTDAELKMKDDRLIRESQIG